MSTTRARKYFFISLFFHALILLAVVLGFDFSSPLPVIENTNQHDVISAVVLGDTPKSKILPQQINNPPPPPQPTPQPQVAKEEPKPPVEPKPQIVPPKKDVIALKLQDKKKVAQQKALAEKMRRELFAKDLLADIQKQSSEQKKVKQKQLQSKFQKMLHDQAEESLRQQLLNEEIKLQGVQSRQAQGVVDKYKALIIQAISEHWVIPSQANKTLYCELMIRLAPGGMVLDVQVTKTSGDPSLDSSARVAVLKSSPLPVPPDSGAFEPFRQFVLKVKPENILANDGGLNAG